LFKLKQELDRVQFERQSLQELLAEATAKTSSPTSTSTSAQTGATTPSDSTATARILQLEKEVASLNESLARSSQSASHPTTRSTTTTSNSSEVKQLQLRISALEKEVAHLTAQYRESFDTQTRLAQENQSLQQQVAKWKEQCERLQQAARSNVVATSTSSVSSASPSPSTTTTTTTHQAPTLMSQHSSSNRLFLKNYFILASESDAAEVATVEQTLTAILHSSTEVDFAKVSELNQFFKLDSGRRKFTQMLESSIKEVCHY
jgi:hypothetical protein